MDESTPEGPLPETSGSRRNSKTPTPTKSPSMRSNRSLPQNKVDSPKTSIVVSMPRTEPGYNMESTSKGSMNSKSSAKKSILKENETDPNSLTQQVELLSDSIQKMKANSDKGNNIDKIEQMSKLLTDEANALKQSIRTLSEDIELTKQELGIAKKEEYTDFPHHLFLLELIINKIQMKCECFETDDTNLVITATFLEKSPIVLYDSSYGKISNFEKINMGKSILFAMTYEKICNTKEFVVFLEMTKQPPCSHCVTKIGETKMDFTKEFTALREELCKKWTEEQPVDNILFNTSTPLTKNRFYLSCGANDDAEAIGVIEVSIRMSFLGKEITTTFSASPRPQGTSLLSKGANGTQLYSCQNVEMDDCGKILLDEDVMKNSDDRRPTMPTLSRTISPTSEFSSISKHLSTKRYLDLKAQGARQQNNEKYDEICTMMNENELKIRVPKTTKIERLNKYDALNDLCSCESQQYIAGEQLQFELPKDIIYPDKNNTYSSNLKYTYKPACEPNKDRKVINITPTNCPVPVNMAKALDPRKDVFILKIGKKLETKDKKTDLEIELVTPKIQQDIPSVATQQVSAHDVTEKKSTELTKKKGKGAKKDKKSKGGAKKKGKK